MPEDSLENAGALVEDCRRQVTLQPNEPEAYALLARALRRDGDVTAAAGAWFEAACAARRAGDEATFRRHLSTCLETLPSQHVLFTSQATDAGFAGSARASESPSDVANGEVGAILVAHADARVRDDLTRRLRDRGHDVVAVASVDATLASLTSFRPDLVITAPTLGVGSLDTAVMVIAACKRVAPNVAVILLTCAARGELVAEPAALQPLVDEHLDRPLSERRLVESVHATLWRRRHAARPPQAPPTIAAGGRFLVDAVRAGLLVAVGYGVIFSAAILLQELSLERMVEQMHIAAATFGVGKGTAAALTATDVQTIDGIRVAATIPVLPNLDASTTAGRFRGNTVSLAGERFANITIEIQDPSRGQIDPVSVCGSIVVDVDGHSYPPPWPPRIIDTRLAAAASMTFASVNSSSATGSSGRTLASGRRFVACTIVTAFPVELLHRPGSRVKLSVGKTSFELAPMLAAPPTPTDSAREDRAPG